MSVLVQKHIIAKPQTIHIIDKDGREIAIRKEEVLLLRKILLKALEQVDKQGQIIVL